MSEGLSAPELHQAHLMAIQCVLLGLLEQGAKHGAFTRDMIVDAFDTAHFAVQDANAPSAKTKATFDIIQMYLDHTLSSLGPE